MLDIWEFFLQYVQYFWCYHDALRCFTGYQIGFWGYNHDKTRIHHVGIADIFDFRGSDVSPNGVYGLQRIGCLTYGHVLALEPEFSHDVHDLSDHHLVVLVFETVSPVGSIFDQNWQLFAFGHHFHDGERCHASFPVYSETLPRATFEIQCASHGEQQIESHQQELKNAIVIDKFYHIDIEYNFVEIFPTECLVNQVVNLQNVIEIASNPSFHLFERHFGESIVFVFSVQAIHLLIWMGFDVPPDVSLGERASDQ